MRFLPKNLKKISKTLAMSIILITKKFQKTSREEYSNTENLFKIIKNTENEQLSQALENENTQLIERNKDLNKTLKKYKEELDELTRKFEKKSNKLIKYKEKINNKPSITEQITDKNNQIKELTEDLSRTKAQLKEKAKQLNDSNKTNIGASTSTKDSTKSFNKPLKISRKASLSNQKIPQITILIDSLIVNNVGWEIKNNNMVLEVDTDYLLIGVIGPKAKGKTSLINKLCEFDYDRDDYIQTKGINLTYGKELQIICMDSEGTNSQIE